MRERRLLIVDDEADFAVMVRRYSESLGFVVEVVTRPLLFKDAYGRFMPTDVMMDVVMPEVDGIELVRWLTAIRSKVRLMIVTGYNPLYASMAEMLAKARRDMRVTTLAKPVSLDQLKDALLS